MTVHPVGVLDTNVIVLMGRVRPADLPAEPVITAVTLAELSVGPLVTDDAVERGSRQARLQETEAAFEPLPFDAPAARTFGRVAAALRRADRQVRPRALDAMIAAIAITHDLPVYTCNPRDFAGISDLTVVPVPYPGTG